MIRCICSARAPRRGRARQHLRRRCGRGYNAIREPYNHYGAAELADEVRALRDSGNTGGFMTWNGASDIGKYAEVIGALN